jgi:hypothetical protein
MAIELSAVVARIRTIDDSIRDARSDRRSHGSGKADGRRAGAPVRALVHLCGLQMVMHISPPVADQHTYEMDLGDLQR